MVLVHTQMFRCKFLQNYDCFFLERLLVFFLSYLVLKITWKVKSCPLGWTVNLRELIWVNVLKNIFIVRYFISQIFAIFIFVVQKVSYNFRYFWLQHVFTIKVKKVFFFADMLLKFLWHALFPQQINHFMLVLITLFSIEWIWI